MNDPLTYFIVNRPLYSKLGTKDDGWTQLTQLADSTEETIIQTTHEDFSEPIRVQSEEADF